jgi:hypothetical protein
MYRIIDSHTGRSIGIYKNIKIVEETIESLEKIFGIKRFYCHKIMRKI